MYILSGRQNFTIANLTNLTQENIFVGDFFYFDEHHVRFSVVAASIMFMHNAS